MVILYSSQSYRKQGEKQKAKPAVSVSQSETSLENEPTLSSLATSAPDVDDTIETAIELVHVVSDIGGKIGGLAILTHHHPILFITIVRGSEPLGTLPCIDDTRFFKSPDCSVHFTGIIQALLTEPFIKTHPERR